MKLSLTGRKIIILMICGFFCGILYANTIGKETMLTTAFLSFDNLKSIFRSNQNSMHENGAYLFYLWKSRGVLFLVCVLFSFLRVRKWMVSMFLLWTGFAFGTFLSFAVFAMGGKGILISILLLFPQWIFYGAAYGILLSYAWNYPGVQWSIQKIFCMLVFFSCGNHYGRDRESASNFFPLK